MAALAGIAIAAAQAPSAAPPASPSAPASQPQAQPPAPPPRLPPNISQSVDRLAAAIDNAEKNIQHLADLEEDLGRLRADVESILADSTNASDELRPQLDAVRSQIEKLGDPPGKDEPAEAPAIAAERARLNALATAIDGAIKTTELTWVRARQLIEKITVLRHSIFTKNLVERLPSPLLPGLWRDVISESPTVGHRIRYLTDDWLHWASQEHGPLVGLLIGALVLFVALGYVVTRFTDRRALRLEQPPSFFERAMSVAWVAPLRALPPIAAAVLLYAGFDMLGLLFPPWNRAAAALLKGILILASVCALVSAVLAPREPHWRLVMLADAPTRRVGRLLYAITAVYAFDATLTDASRAFFVPLSLTVVQSFIASTAFAGLLIGLLLTPFTPPSAADAGGPVPRHSPRWLKMPLWLIALGILGLALLGYVALARFIAQQVVMTATVLVVCWLMYLAIRAVTREPQQRRYPMDEMLEARFGLDGPRRNQLARLIEIALSFALVIGALPLLMLQWGFSGADIRDWFKALFFGLEVGQFRISLARILLGILLFIGLLFTTRLFQRWLREKALQEARVDPGIINSIDTVIGYAGIALAALLAVSYAGLDITNLAIVAGALSVGIGFGLQSIVNNFVSGLILLIERPIRVGDRIVVGDQQGLVRRISVRATEIETFDRASLIVPNSELITGRVLNWTHRDSLGAVNVKIGVGYDADPERVIAILVACAEAHQGVLRVPAPGASLDGFGDSALLFNLRISVPDINQAAGVQSDLRIAILKAFQEAGIEIPYNRVDVSLCGADTIKALVAGAVEESTERPSPAPGNGKRSGA